GPTRRGPRTMPAPARSRVGERGAALDLEAEVVDVAVPPVLARLVGLDDRVVLVVEMGGGVAMRRVVTAADVTARHAHAQVHPPAADAEAVLAPVARGRDIRHLVQMAAVLVHAVGHRT